jgi:hypothetical protein
LFSGKTIFLAALDWGLGHATRCVPLIRDLEKKNKVIIGITPLTAKIFNYEFPHLQKINIPPYDIAYSALLPLWLKLFFSWNRISGVIREEHKLLEEMISRNSIDVVISDNRFGWHSRKAYSVFITHQVFLKTPFANNFAQRINKEHILKFNELWIPDYEESARSLSGELSHGVQFHDNVKYIGPLSRLQKTTMPVTYDYLFLLSGPEPQRSIFKQALASRAKALPALRFALVDPENTKPGSKNINLMVNPGAQQLSEAICSSRKIICRSGYSSLMDLHTLGKKEMILVPTPGQTEQEYLADYWSKHHQSAVVSQKNFGSFPL